VIRPRGPKKMMARYIQLSICLLGLAMLASEALFAQAEQTPEKLLDEPLTEAAPEEESEPEDDGYEASQETDFNEENFRRAMELRDQELQRSPDLMTGSYSSGTGLRALDELPESSQKHLRDELREVIVSNGPWTPGDAGETYPFVPSPEAEENGTLKNREAAAWDQLVAKYHEREAALQANATSMETGNPGEGQAGNPGEGQAGNEGEGQTGKQGEDEAGEEERRAQRAEALAKLLESGEGAGSGSDAENASMAEQGVSQNAMQLLMQRQQVTAQSVPMEVSKVVVQDVSQDSSQAGEQDSSTQERAIEFDTEGVIAIEDLDKVNLDPNASRDQ